MIHVYGRKNELLPEIVDNFCEDLTVFHGVVFRKVLKIACLHSRQILHLLDESDRCLKGIEEITGPHWTYVHFEN